MKLEDLVPPLELCKLIPKGEFEDTAFCWLVKDYACVLPTSQIYPVKTPFVELRRYTVKGDYIPAPTLEEIMEKLPPLQEVFRDEFKNGETLWRTDWGGFTKHATEAALKSWFFQKGIKYETK